MLSDQDSFSGDVYQNLGEDEIFLQIKNYSALMRKRVKAAILFMLVMSSACTILATLVWKKDRNKEVPSSLLLDILFILTAFFDLFQILVLG